MELDKQTIEKYKKAGEIAARAREYACSLIKPNVLVSEVADKTEDKILELGGEIAFPAQFSINQIAAHYCPTYEEKLYFKDGDVVKVDVGVHIDGYVGDTAKTVIVGKSSEELENLRLASLEALNSALKKVRPGVTTSELGREIETAIRKRNLIPIKNLSGHGLAKFTIHTFPNIPNYETSDNFVLEEGMVIAIEPFATNGLGMIHEKGIPTIFALTHKKPVRGIYTRRILNELNKEGLPFALRWLEKKFKKPEIMFALRELRQLDMLREHPPLPDFEDGLVSQHEHTILVLKNPMITTKLD